MHVLIPFCTSIDSPSFYQDFAEGLEEALAELGHTSERFGFRDIGALAPQELERFSAWMRDGRCDLVLDLCCWGYALSRMKARGAKGGAGATIFDSLGARYAALLFDQPYFQPVPALTSEALYLCCPDRGHAELIGSLYPSLHPCALLFSPPATRPLNDRSPDRIRERSIPLLYAGNLAPEAVEPFWSGAPQRRIYDGVAELTGAQPETPLHRAIEAVRRSLGLELAQEERLEAYRTLELFLRHRLRHRMVSAFAAAGLPLEVYGRGWETAGLPANVRVHAPMDYRTYMGLIGDARICLDATTYLDGANDRVVQFAVNGTVFFSNAGAYLREAFGGAAGFYSSLEPGAAADQVRELLERPAELEARGARLREIALRDHLWRNRLEALFAAMR